MRLIFWVYFLALDANVVEAYRVYLRQQLEGDFNEDGDFVL